MLKISLSSELGAAPRILCLGAHSDDIEIGCGGTVMKLVEECADLEIIWIVLGAQGERAEEARESARAFLGQVKTKSIVVKGYRDGYFPYIGAEIKDYFEQLKQELAPHLIFTHYRHDLHQDHRLLCELTWNTFRDHLILEYEVPKYDGDLGAPNLFVHLDEVICRRKVKHILGYFGSQQSRSWFTEDTFWAIMRLRGVESNSPGKYAEAFYARKLVLGTRNLPGDLSSDLK